MANGDESCWCFELPHALPVSRSDAHCFCQACLERLIDRCKVVAGETDQGSG
jgi:hypothetical protein